MPQVLVFNKLDAVETSRRPLRLQDFCEVPDAAEGGVQRLERIFVSARSGEGLAELRRLLASRAEEAEARALAAAGQTPTPDEPDA